MNIPSVVILDDQKIGFFNSIKTSVLPDISFNRLLKSPNINGNLSVVGGAENATASITIDNGDGLMSNIFIVPRIGKKVIIYNNENEEFTGSIQSILIEDVITLVVES